MKPIRSFLFVPGSRASWIDKVPGYGADAVILDLEDSVPESGKDAARALVHERIPGLAAAGQRVYVRINRSPHMYSFEDVMAVVVQGLEGILLPKPYGLACIEQIAALVAEAEMRNGVAAGSVTVVPTLETAESVQHAYAIACHPRVPAIVGVSAKDADIARSVGFRWTRGGQESLYIKSQAVIAARAAGKLPMAGLWQEVHDLEGLRESAAFHRQLGFTGEFVLHPSNVAIVNETYSPSADELAYYRGLIEAFEAGQAEGRAAVTYRGEHIDYAHVKTAREIVALAAG